MTEHANRVLTDEQVKIIKQQLKIHRDNCPKMLARAYNVSIETIRRINRGKYPARNVSAKWH